MLSPTLSTPTSSDEIHALLERCRQGEQPAWESLVNLIEPRVYAMAYRYLRQREEARDLTQDVFVRLYDRLETWSGDAAMAWILSLTRHLAIDRLRRLKTRPPAEDILLDAGVELLDPAPGPEAVQAETTRRRLLRQALSTLAEPAREMIVLKEIQGWSVKELAAHFALPVGTVKSRSNRARLELARAIVAIDPSYGDR
jgi:RNA polymerase sigma-70 factor (ECF subfamily)